MNFLWIEDLFEKLSVMNNCFNSDSCMFRGTFKESGIDSGNFWLSCIDSGIFRESGMDRRIL